MGAYNGYLNCYCSYHVDVDIDNIPIYIYIYLYLRCYVWGIYGIGYWWRTFWTVSRKRRNRWCYLVWMPLPSFLFYSYLNSITVRVWIPSKRVVCTGDLFIWAFPNAGNPQKVQRYPQYWAQALRKMIDKKPRILLPGIPSIHPSVHLSIHISIYPSIHLSIYQSINLSIYLSI